MKKIISFFVAVLLVVSLFAIPAFAAESTSVYGVKRVEAEPGDTVTVQFKIDNNTGFDSTKMTVTASDPLSITGISQGLMDGGVINLEKGIINHASAVAVTADGTLFTVTVKVSESAQPGEYPVNLSVTRLNNTDVSLDYTVSGGSVLVVAPECDHDWQLTDSKEPTCTEDGFETYTCSKCGDSYTNTLKATGHKPGEPVKENVVPSTCTEKGSYDNVVYCSVCGEELSRETIFVKLADHQRDVSIKDDTYHTWTCKVCGDKFDEKHDKEEDDYHIWCDICGWEKDKPQDSGDDNRDNEPQLGDIDTPFGFGIAALIVMACGVAFVCKRKFVK